jgi:hypothetical protein
VKRVALPLFAALWLACGGSGNPKLDGPCNATCDCKRTDAPSKCIGEWVCNASKTCEYTCQAACSGPVSTCPDGTECNGSICSARKVAACAP